MLEDYKCFSSSFCFFFISYLLGCSYNHHLIYNIQRKFTLLHCVKTNHHIMFFAGRRALYESTV